MKRKATAELEVLEWLERKLQAMYPRKPVSVCKSGGDVFLWFLRQGGITREPDFEAAIGKETISFEFQYAEKPDLPLYDFKVSKVAPKRKGKREPLENKQFIYIVKPLLKYAIFSPKWVFENGEYGMVPAWRSYAYRVPKEKFQKLLNYDESLKTVCRKIDIKNFILNFQHRLIDINKEKLSHLLQDIIDENKMVKIIPKDLDSFFKVCFILDNINKIPENANLWLMYLLTYIDDENTLEDISKIVYCIDFLYSKIELKPNELNNLIAKIKELMGIIQGYEQKDGSYKSSLSASPIDEIRYALFSINLIEDLIQDIIFYYEVEDLVPVKKIYENVRNIEKTYALIKSESGL
jgi:hypothetical protein